MRKTLLALAGATALCASTGTALATGSSGHGPDHPPGKDRPNAAQTCKAQRTELGVAAFRQLYGTNANKANAFARCVAKTKAMTQQEREDVSNAARACRDEWKADAAAFAQKYGTNANKRNAFGKCVSAKRTT
ncbi:hypothetical protein [Capillimicrobium parvum]|uniref:Uncharacterized protein n=1 Tax=Capillimicrobium parvum TaxID=2884022 RepID=A0A9E6Y2A4_9ACTN|nr:hypothetical protein [Capillimicrobium parvum]UGS38576.1 hypothetical protein DSM104329_05006 [Capillimicrobium parvum]